jgi:diaminopimelate decarboxylase
VLVGNAGVLLTRVEYIKQGEEKNFAIVDAAMNDLMRPALYDAYHQVLPVAQTPSPQSSGEATSHSTKLASEQVTGYPASGRGGEREIPSLIFDVVGPICETGDFIARNRSLAIAPQSLLAVMSAGAYGMSMSSNYNTRPRAAEVMVDGDAVHLVRERETIAHLLAGEKTLA